MRVTVTRGSEPKLDFSLLPLTDESRMTPPKHIVELLQAIKLGLFVAESLVNLQGNQEAVRYVERMRQHLEASGYMDAYKGLPSDK